MKQQILRTFPFLGSWIWAIKYALFYKNNFFGFIFDTFYTYYNANNCQFVIPKDLTPRYFRARFFWDVYERYERQLVDTYFGPKDIILELGACLGVVSCIANKKQGGNGLYVAVEANPKVIPYLEQNKQINNANFKICNCLVSNTSDGTFYLHELVVGGSAQQKNAEKITVPVKTLAQIAQEYAIDKGFNALIIDIEGGEYDFLHENQVYLSNINKIMIEWHNYVIGDDATNQCKALLQNKGFRLIKRYGYSDYWEK